MVIVLGYFIVNFYVLTNKIEQTEINGLIQEIKYDDKGYPIVKINMIDYHFSFGKKDNEPVYLGDSISKMKDSHSVDLYRNGNFIRSYEW
jgi:hypothetical protein